MERLPLDGLFNWFMYAFAPVKMKAFEQFIFVFLIRALGEEHESLINGRVFSGFNKSELIISKAKTGWLIELFKKMLVELLRVDGEESSLDSPNKSFNKSELVQLFVLGDELHSLQPSLKRRSSSSLLQPSKKGSDGFSLNK